MLTYVLCSSHSRVVVKLQVFLHCDQVANNVMTSYAYSSVNTQKVVLGQKKNPNIYLNKYDMMQK